MEGGGEEELGDLHHLQESSWTKRLRWDPHLFISCLISIPKVYMSGTKSVLDKQLDDYRFLFLSFKFSSFGSRHFPFFGLQ